MQKLQTLLFLAVMALPLAILAQDNPGITDVLAPQPFYVDYAAFRSPSPDTVILEVYYKIFSSSLPYQKYGDKFRADYSVDITISKKNKQITGTSNDGSLTADNYKATISKDDFVINKIIFRIPPDSYRLNARLRDRNSVDLVRPVALDLKLRGFGQDIPAISSIEFLRQAGAIEQDSQFVRGDKKLIPSVSIMYGDDCPDLIFYYEVYNNPDFKGEYLASYHITNGDKFTSIDTTLFPSQGKITPHTESIDVDSLAPGDYKIETVIHSPGSKLEIKHTDTFFIGWSVIGLVKNDYKTAVDQLRYIASRDQMKKLLDAAPQDHLRVWNEFWASQDPTPSTPENEKKEEYYKRVRYADLNFGNFGRNGWKTDMGMVYITYGPPDEIERHPFDIDSKPYQIWYYYEQKRVFSFVDVNGYGDYELIYTYDGDIRKTH
jgi:GWxTD domain-containing protein